MSPRATRRRRILLGMAILGAGLLAAALAAADWRLVRAEYHAFRLNRAQTREAADPHLEALLELAGHEPAARAVVAKLGAERQWLTFWVFRAMVSLECGPPLLSEPQYSRLLPWLRLTMQRLARDRYLMQAWAQFVRWWGDGFLQDQRVNVATDYSFPEDFMVPVGETFVRRQHLILLESLWTSGAPATGDFTRWTACLTSGEEVLAYAEAIRAETEHVHSWFESQAAPRDLALPRVPLPGWEGPVPEDVSRAAVYFETLLPPGATGEP